MCWPEEPELVRTSEGISGWGMTAPEPWRKTGRRAKDEHWLGLARLAVVEVSLYDDHGNQQGRGVIQLGHRGLDNAEKDGQTWMGVFLAIEDGYYEWWVKNHYQQNFATGLAFHFCAKQSHRCTEATVYRDPIHVDVFRVLPGRTFLELSWLTAAKKTEAEKNWRDPDVSAQPGAPDPGAAGSGKPGGAADAPVEEGAAGIRGLAQALGAGNDEGLAEEAQEPKKKKAKTGEKDEKKEKEKGLKGVIDGRKAQQASSSALSLKNKDEEKRKKKKKKKKDKKEKKKEAKDESSSSYSDSGTSSSTGSLFRIAALPQGVDRIHRLHQQRPGALADLTLRRFQELLSRAIGGGTATGGEELPAVARAYLNQIYLAKNTEGSIGLRNLRELRTLALIVDMVASNDPLRALDVAIQRMKSIELFIAQGQWTQASLLELVLPEEEQRAWFRQELKAAQQEYKSEVKLHRDQYPRRRQQWNYPAPTNNTGEKKEGDQKDETPPGNGGGTGKGKKGKGKGKKGFRRW